MGEHEFGRDVPSRRVCVRCRRAYAGRQHWTRRLPGFSKWRTDRPCAGCGGPTVPISHSTLVPPRRDKRRWRDLTATLPKD